MRIKMRDATFCLLSSQSCHSRTWRCQTAQPLYSFVRYQFPKQDFLSSPRWSRRYEINITIPGFSVNLIILLVGPSCLTSGHSVGDIPDRAEREQHGKVLLAKPGSNLKPLQEEISEDFKEDVADRFHSIVLYITYSKYDHVLHIDYLNTSFGPKRLSEPIEVCSNLFEADGAVSGGTIREHRVQVICLQCVLVHGQTLTNNAARGEVEIRRLAEQFPRLKGEGVWP